MGNEVRVRIEDDGSIRLPKDMMEKLGWGMRNYLEVTVTERSLRLEKVEGDPFAEAMKKPDSDALDKLIAEQSESQKKALDTFAERIKSSPEVRPEDRPDYWR